MRQIQAKEDVYGNAHPKSAHEQQPQPRIEQPELKFEREFFQQPQRKQQRSQRLLLGR